MTHRVSLRILGRCFSLVALLAACAVCSPAQVIPHSGDLAFDGGYSYIGKGNNFNTTSINRYTLGFSGGANLNEYVTVIGEYNHFSMPQVQGVNMGMSGYGGAVRFNLASKGRVVPYGVFGGGGARLTASESGVGVSSNGGYFGGGGGANLYLGKNWGIRPEFRYNRYFYTFDGINGNTNVLTAAAGVFFQFGGKSKTASAMH
jgi:hypothetical protein